MWSLICSELDYICQHFLSVLLFWKTKVQIFIHGTNYLKHYAFWYCWKVTAKRNSYSLQNLVTKVLVFSDHELLEHYEYGDHELFIVKLFS